MRRDQRFHPWDEVDPEYGRLLRRAVQAAVEAPPDAARVERRGIRPAPRLPRLL
jgi:DNA-binding sugar fermentation-stimulating protein